MAYEELITYKELIIYLAENEKDFIFENDSLEKASAVTEAILRYSKSEIRIFDKHLNGDITEDFPTILEAFKRLGNKTLKVIIEGKFEKDKKIYGILGDLSAKYPDKVIVKRGTVAFENLVREIFKDNSLAYFTLGDSKSYRLEIVNNIESCEVAKEAECNFNDKDSSVVGKLIKVFDEGFGSEKYCKPFAFK